MKKSGLLLVSLVLVLLLTTIVAARIGLPGSPDVTDGGVTDFLKKVGITILEFFTFNWIQGGTAMLLAFIRACVWLITFSLFYVGLGVIPNIGRARVVIAIVLALIGALFIPPQFLILIGQTYGTFVVFGFIMSAIVAAGMLVYQIPATNWFLILVRIGIIGFMMWTFNRVGEQAKFLATRRPTDPAIGALFSDSFAGGASGGAAGGLVTAWASIATIGQIVLGVWMAIEFLRLLGSFGAAGAAGGVLNNAFTRAMNNMMNNVPGGGGGGNAPGGGGGGGGGGGNVNLQPIEQAINNLQQLVTNQHTNMLALNTDTNARVQDIQVSVRQLLQYAQAMIAFFEGWADYFVNTVGPQLDRVSAEVTGIGTVQVQHTGTLNTISSNVGTLLTRMENMRNELVAGLTWLDTKIDGIVENLGNLMSTVGNVVKGVTSLTAELGAVKSSIGTLPNDVRTALQPEFESIQKGLIWIEESLKNEVGNTIAKVESVLTAVHGVPDNVKLKLASDLKDIKDAISKITPGTPVDYDKIKQVIEKAQSEIGDDVGAALQAVKNELKKHASDNIYGDSPGSMFKKLETQLKEMMQKIKNIKPGKSGQRQVQEIGGDCNGIGNIINSNVNVILNSLGKGSKDIPTLIEGLHDSVETQRLGALLAELKKTAEKLKKLSVDVSKYGGQRKGDLKLLNDATRELGKDFAYNLRISNDLRTFITIIKDKSRTVKNARTALRKVARWERQDASRTNLERVIAELKKLGAVIDQTEVEEAERLIPVYTAAKIAELSRVQGDFTGRLDKIEQAKNTGSELTSWVGICGAADKLRLEIAGLIIVEERLLKVVKSATKKIKTK